MANFINTLNVLGEVFITELSIFSEFTPVVIVPTALSTKKKNIYNNNVFKHKNPEAW